MTKAQALQSFWSSFGLEAYEKFSVPTGDHAPSFPYITYSAVFDSFLTEVALTGKLWYRSTTLKEINAKTQEVSDQVGSLGVFIPCEDGKLWIKRGSPFAQNINMPEDDSIKVKYLNLVGEFFTNN